MNLIFSTSTISLLSCSSKHVIHSVCWEQERVEVVVQLLHTEFPKSTGQMGVLSMSHAAMNLAIVELR